MQLTVEAPRLQAVLSISHDWFEFAVISLAATVVAVTGNIGLDSWVEDIQNHVALRRAFRPEFEVVRTQLLAKGLVPETVVEVPGWETWAGRVEQGRWKREPVSGADLTLGMQPSLIRMTERIKACLRRLTPEQQRSLSRGGIHATGAALEIPGLVPLLSRRIGCPVIPFSAPRHPSIEGARQMLSQLRFLKKVK